MSLFEKYIWYPPAEVKLPLSLIVSALFSNGSDLENELNKYLGTENCICANSGRALFSTLLDSLYNKDKDKRNEVLLPAYTCYSVAAAVVRAGLKIRVYDIDPVTFEPDYISFKKGLNGNVLSAVVQYLFGISIGIGEMMNLTKDAGVYLIEDAAQALGAQFGERKLGTIADFGFYSFGRGKPFPIGCGGGLVGKDKTIVDSIILPVGGNGIINFAMTVFTQIFSHRLVYGIMEALPLGLGLTIYDPGFKISLMPELIKKLGKK